jgi:hypothetical protein
MVKIRKYKFTLEKCGFSVDVWVQGESYEDAKTKLIKILT